MILYYQKNDYVEHGSQRKSHKYIERIATGVDENGNTQYRYFYTQAELDAYNEGRRAGWYDKIKADEKVDRQYTLQITNKKLGNKIKRAIKRLPFSVKRSVKNISNDIKEKGEKFANKYLSNTTEIVADWSLTTSTGISKSGRDTYTHTRNKFTGLDITSKKYNQ